VPERVPQRSLAPDWVSPTEGNGSGLPRADLHIALIAGSPEDFAILKRVRVIQPPLWPGKIHLHILHSTEFSDDDLLIRQTVVDLGWADARDVAIGPPASITEGYPSGTQE